MSTSAPPLRGVPACRPMRALAAMAIALAAVAAAARPAHACSLFGYSPMTLGDHGDTVAPTLAVRGVTVWRGGGSCAGTGLIEIAVDASDDRGTVGFQVRAVRGDATALSGLPETPFTQPVSDLSLYFGDAGQALDLTLEVRAVDLDGNLSAPVTVDVIDPSPTDDRGCAVGGAGGSGLLAVVVVARARRRRARRA